MAPYANADFTDEFEFEKTVIAKACLVTVGFPWEPTGITAHW